MSHFSGNHHDVMVSVIIPTFNKRAHLLLLLKSLANQSVKNFEVLVVDDGGGDKTGEAVTDMMKTYPVPLRYDYLANTGIFGAGIARNYGAKQAKGPILLFLDQDCVAQENLVKHHMAQHTDKDIVLGYYAGYTDEDEAYDFADLERYAAQKISIPLLNDFRDGLFHREACRDAWKCFVSAHFSIKKDIFQENNFDESFVQWGCEDIDLGYRLYQAGREIHFSKDCVVYNSSHDPRRTKEKFASLIKSLMQMYAKYQTEELRLYCFERFYHTPLKYRGSLQLFYEDGRFAIRESQTKILIGKNGNAVIAAGEDLGAVVDTVEQISPLITRVHCDVKIIKRLSEPLLLDFRKAFHRLIRVLRDKKIKINFDDIRRQSFLMETRLIGPKRLGISFYNTCNLRCLFCSINSPLRKTIRKDVSRFLDLKTIEGILNEAYEMGVEVIRLSSDGEPFLFPEIDRILENIAKKDFELHILTNGTAIEERHIAVLNRIHRRMNFLVNFSAATKPAYQKIHGGGPQCYDKAVHALSMLSAFRDRKLQHGEQAFVGTTFLITKINYHEIAAHVRLMNSLGVDHVYFKFAILYDEAEELLLDKKDIAALKKELLKAKLQTLGSDLQTNIHEILANIDDQGFKNKNDIKEHRMNLPFQKCYNGWFFGNINCYGNYYICCRESVPVGNVREQSFKEVFFSSYMKDLLAEGASGISLDKPMWRICNYCYHLDNNRQAKEWLDQQ